MKRKFSIIQIDDMNDFNTKRIRFRDLVIYKCANCGADAKRQFRSYKHMLCEPCRYKKSMIDKYGVERPVQSTELRDKIKKTKKRLYGDENYTNRDKAERTNFAKYGVKNPLESEEFREKARQTKKRLYGDENYTNHEKTEATNLAKYGVKSTLSLPDVQEKIKQTNIALYGVDNVLKSEEFKERIKATNLALHGSEYIGGSKEIQEKIKQTMNVRYGSDSYMGTEEFREKSKESNLAKYGVEYAPQSKEFQDKVKATNLRKYGVEHYFQSKDAQQKRRRKYAYGNENFDSSWELALWIYANDHGEQIEFADTYFEYTSDGKLHRYYPDFKYKGELIEIKGSQFRNDETLINPYDSSQNGTYDAKYKCAIDNGVKFMFAEDLQFAIDYARNKFGGSFQWYNKFNITPMPDPVQSTPLLPMMPMYIYLTIPMMLPWWMFMTPCDFHPYSTNVFEREGMEFVDCECEYE